MKLHSETLFQYFQIDHCDLASRIKSIKCQLLTTGIWGQSKHGKNVDLNKLIQGICSFDSSLSFIYKLTKCIYNNSLNQDTNLAIFKDCIQLPYQLINTTYDPFTQTLPKEDEFVDAERFQQVENDINDILDLQEQDLTKINERLSEDDQPKELGNINEKIKQNYINKMKKVNQLIDQLKGKKQVLEQIQQQNEVNDDPRYTLIFPTEYINILQEYNQLQNNVIQNNPIPDLKQIKDQTKTLIDQEFYFIQ
ncbi:unnamed protein product [Paramecium primaurelia]|uniref:Uncharacterized protein n=1 Tax=Paramecium primaurelia TaxID=5886 RepID=A0A8S1JRL0_PARPR|nr:unnamed protein product [Paramecium primaurelia]